MVIHLRLKVFVGLVSLLLLACLSLSLTVTGSTTHAATCGGVDTSFVSCDDQASGGTEVSGIWSLLLIVINILTAGVGVLAVGGFVYAAIMYTTAEDKAEQVNQAKTIMLNVVIGLVAFGLMYSLLQFLVPGGVFNSIGAPRVSTATRDSLPGTDSGPTSGGGSSSGTSGSGGSPTGGGASNPAATASFSAGQVLIIGDSITQRAVDDTNRGNKGWWEYLLIGKSGMFKFSAQGGSGYVTQGDHGTGTTFTERLPAISRIKPKAIIIAGGLNDRGKANASSGITSYFTKLKTILASNNIPPQNVYVCVPRPDGTAAAIVRIVKSNASRIGVKYIEVGTYTATYDALHPTSASAKRIFTNFTANSNFDERLKR